jgi:PAS domain S-box-containing protein
MATFACYYKEIKTPSGPEENTIQRAGQILQIILESYQRERALKISNERFEYATEATSDIIWDWNLETNAVYYSGNIQKLFGHTPGINMDNLPFYFEHVHPDDRERVVLYPDQVKYSTMVNWTQEYRFRKANGEYAFVLDKGIVIRDKRGVGVRMIGAIQDVTVMKQNELRIMQQNEQLTEIALINAHEIRRPVATILGLIQLFNKETSGGESNKDILKHLETVTQELDTVIRRIIDKTVE